MTGDPIHRFFYQQAQIDGGRMDKFVAYTNMGALVMGFYDGSHTKLWEYAQRYTLADHFFHAAFGGSFLNHFWMICACTPIYKDAPESLKAGLTPLTTTPPILFSSSGDPTRLPRRLCRKHAAALRPAAQR